MSRQTILCKSFIRGKRHFLSYQMQQQQHAISLLSENLFNVNSAVRPFSGSGGNGNNSSVVEKEGTQRSSPLKKFFAETATQSSIAASSSSSLCKLHSNESMTNLAQKLFSYENIKQAQMEHEGDLLGDIVLVADYFTKNQPHRPILIAPKQPQQQPLLCCQLGQLVTTLVVPLEETEITDTHAIDSILRAVHLTLKTYAHDASKGLSMEDGLDAQDLLRKISSLKFSSSCGTSNTVPPKKMFAWQRSLLYSCNHVLNMWAKLAGSLEDFQHRRMAVLHAEHLLIDMPVAPDIVSFNTVITAWAKCGSQQRTRNNLNSNNRKKPDDHGTKAAERAEALLHLLLELAAAQKASGTSQPLTPTAVTYSAVLQAWVDSGDPQAAERATSLLHDMVDRNESLGHQGPTAHTFSQVFHALAKNQLQDVHMQVRELLLFMESLQIQPNTVVYNTIMKAYSNSKPRSTKEMYKVCGYMDDIAQRMASSLPMVQADRTTYQTLIHGWLDCAIQRGQTRTIVNDCKRRAVAHLEAAVEQKVPIEIHTFHRTMMAFSLDVTLVEKLFSMMSIHPHTKITLESYAILLDSLQKATRGPRDSAMAKKAEHYLYEMDKLTGQRQDLFPDTSCFNSVIMAWNATKTAEGAERAGIILDHMCKTYQMQVEQLYKDRTFRLTSRPNTTSFMNVIAAIGRQSNGPESIPRVEALIKKMTDFAQARTRAAPNIAKKLSPAEPNTITYNALLALYARHCHGNNITLRDKAESLIENMECIKEPDKQPDRYSYTSLVIAYGKCEESLDKVMTLLDKLQNRAPKKGKELDNQFFKVVLKTIEESEQESKAEKIEEVLARMESGTFGNGITRPDAHYYQMVHGKNEVE